jgi:hypothetical protein
LNTELGNDKTRTLLYHQEMAARLYAAQAILEDPSRSSLTFVHATNFAYAKPMFLSVWTTMLAVFRHVYGGPC